MALVDTLEQMLTPIVTGLGCDLWGLEFSVHGRYATLRIFVDKVGGSTIDDCERVSRQVSALMDVEDPIDVPYRLEVSTPGLDRSFFRFDQLTPYIGQEIKIRLHSRGPGRKRNFIGQLLSAIDGQIVIRGSDDGQDHQLVWSDVDKSSLVFRFED